MSSSPSPPAFGSVLYIADSAMNGAAAIDKAKLNGLNEEDSKNGAVVHTFDPNSTPQEKAAAAAKGQHGWLLLKVASRLITHSRTRET